jgi:hypothetical protein
MRFLQAPGIRIAGREAVLGAEIAQLADLAGAGAAHGFQVVGFEVAAVADHQLLAGLFAGGDHGFAFGRGDGHRLLAHHVLARCGGADGVLGVHRHRQADVDDVDVRIVLDAVEILVIVDAAFRHAVFGRHALGLDRVAADQRHQLAVLAVLELRNDHAQAIHAQPDNRIAELALRRRRHHRQTRRRCHDSATSSQHNAASIQINHLLLLFCWVCWQF